MKVKDVIDEVRNGTGKRAEYYRRVISEVSGLEIEDDTTVQGRILRVQREGEETGRPLQES